MNSRKISFLICTRNRSEVVFACVSNLLSSKREDLEVVVRDNSSTDDTVSRLATINDTRLRVVEAPRNQGTLNFFEILKHAEGDIVTWMSDEDDFLMDRIDSVITHFNDQTATSVVLSSVVVGQSGGIVRFQDVTQAPASSAALNALSYSGCGGMFVRRTLLEDLLKFSISSSNEAYELWNFYPVSFIVAHALRGTVSMISEPLCVQARFATTTNEWSREADPKDNRRAHYYPDAVADRLASNIVSAWNMPFNAVRRYRIVVGLLVRFLISSRSFNDPQFLSLLRENYAREIVSEYERHVKSLSLDGPLGQIRWTAATLVCLPTRVFRVRRSWARSCTKQLSKR